MLPPARSPAALASAEPGRRAQYRPSAPAIPGAPTRFGRGGLAPARTAVPVLRTGEKSDAVGWYRCTALAPIAQGIERLPPEQKAAGSNPAGGTHTRPTSDASSETTDGTTGHARHPHGRTFMRQCGIVRRIPNRVKE